MGIDHGGDAPPHRHRRRGAGLDWRHAWAQVRPRGGQVEVTLVDSKRTLRVEAPLHEIAAGSMDIGDHEVPYLAQAHWHGFPLPSGR